MNAFLRRVEARILSMREERVFAERLDSKGKLNNPNKAEVPCLKCGQTTRNTYSVCGECQRRGLGVKKLKVGDVHAWILEVGPVRSADVSARFGAGEKAVYDMFFRMLKAGLVRRVSYGLYEGVQK